MENCKHCKLCAKECIYADEVSFNENQLCFTCSLFRALDKDLPELGIWKEHVTETLKTRGIIKHNPEFTGTSCSQPEHILTLTF